MNYKDEIIRYAAKEAVSEEDIEEHVLKRFVLSTASDYRNKRIEKYLWSGCE